MAESDWTYVDNGLSASQVARGVTAGPERPPGGGSFVIGFNSRVTDSGVVGLFYNRSNFAPLLNDSSLATGVSIRGAIKRGVSGANTNFAPFFFACLRSGSGASPNPDVDDIGYLLGLEDADPHRIVLRKGAPSGGIPSTASEILASSAASYNNDTWLHLRLDVIVNPNGDVVLACWQNDLEASGADVDTPSWAAISGIADYMDDSLGVNTGSTPLSGGFVGIGFQSAALDRRAYFDHVQIYRQK